MMPPRAVQFLESNLLQAIIDKKICRKDLCYSLYCYLRCSTSCCRRPRVSWLWKKRRCRRRPRRGWCCSRCQCTETDRTWHNRCLMHGERLLSNPEICKTQGGSLMTFFPPCHENHFLAWIFTLKQWTDFPDFYGAHAPELTRTHLKKEHREPHKYQGKDIRNQECTAAVPVAQIGKPPDVTESNCKAEAGKQELNRVIPFSSCHILIRIGAAVIVDKRLIPDKFGIRDVKTVLVL